MPNPTPPRKPTPRAVPTTLAELVLDLEARAPGDAASELLLPPEEWKALLDRARLERDLSRPSPPLPALSDLNALVVEEPKSNTALDAFAELGELREIIEGCREGTACGPAAGLVEVLSEVVRIWQALRERNVDASSYTFSKIAPEITAWCTENDGKGKDPSGREVNVRFLLDGGEGCVLGFQEAREVAHEILRKVDQALFPPEPAKKTAKKKSTKKPEAKKKQNRGRDPDAEILHRMGGGRQVGDPPELSASETGLIAASGRRLNGAGWKRGAAKAREEDSTSTCHHCGEDDEETVLTTVTESVSLPMGTFCPGCILRLQMDPKEWERHSPQKVATKEPAQIELTEAIAEKTEKEARRAPGRPTKKFPNGGKDPGERCTKCGRTFGSHAGTSCPKAAHGEHPDDFDSEGRLIGTGAAA